MSSLGTLVPTAACLVYTVVYVGSLYVLPYVYDLLAGTDRSAMSAPRDDPRVIRRRLLAASAGTVCNLAILWVLLQYYGAVPEARYDTPLSVHEFLRVIGLPLWSAPGTYGTSGAHLLWKNVVATPLLAIVLTALLYSGSLYMDYLDASSQGAAHDDRTFLLEWVRNFVVGPGTEELVFRSCMLATLRFAQTEQPSRFYLIFTPPLYFGLAHLHHAWETYKRHGRTRRAIRLSVLTTALQFGYTSIFGWYADFLFLRTGTITAPLAAHVLCNALGLPRVPGRHYPAAKGQLVWTIHTFGVVAFWYSLWPLTETRGSMYW